MATNAFLSYDVLILVLGWFRDDYSSLCAVSLVNHTFREASATYLYRKVTYSPEFSPVLDLRKRDDLREGLFVSALLPHNAPLVRRFEVSGYISTRPAQISRLSKYMKTAVESWPNLNTLVFAPKKHHDALFTEVLPLLPHLSCLRNFTVNVSCADEKHVPALVQLRNLESLTIQSPTRALLQSLPQWLEELQSTLRNFRLTQSCGSVTPGVLRSFLPYLHNTPSFALGLSYSLTDDDMFKFWEDLPCLQTLDFRYYLQMRPSINPRLAHLRHLTVRYSSVSTTDETNRLCRWVRRVIANAPLETLRLICENETDGVAVSFHPLVEHLSAKHATRLRILDMPGCYVPKDALSKLCRTCTALEEVALSISTDTLIDFPSFARPSTRLHTVTFNIRNHWCRCDISQDLAETLVRSAPTLRRVTVDGHRYEVRHRVDVVLCTI
ncbi:uncharacterized protein TRAVEDRAFT_127248 [Trametes versicolor FP-101664 SS1]|uniref:uncharacterized protein n=1 Tax=Trametes versicolor (strain FP-101664) TaxID=717944 RepID=UPI00046244EE|nr:uncharacterized protein TRAVEDRAFT_127248 [Trametes versicolor FP-101664 SS1]EIW56873.1 hypothetical protein TRAVEDRAFT_127248 [Trametes versicolor FP-101664 SS1]